MKYNLPNVDDVRDIIKSFTDSEGHLLGDTLEEKEKGVFTGVEKLCGTLEPDVVNVYFHMYTGQMMMNDALFTWAQSEGNDDLAKMFADSTDLYGKAASTCKVVLTDTGKIDRDYEVSRVLLTALLGGFQEEYLDEEDTGDEVSHEPAEADA